MQFISIADMRVEQVVLVRQGQLSEVLHFFLRGRLLTQVLSPVVLARLQDQLILRQVEQQSED